MKKIFGLIGYPLRHTLSKYIHENLFYINNIDGKYRINEIRPSDLSKEINNLKKYDGFNVTLPYKVEIIDYLDEIDEEAEKCGSVNVVVNKRGKLIGYNTDIFGFEKSLIFHEISSFSNVCILGFGGVGRTIAYYFLKNKISVTVAVKDYSNEKIDKIKKFNKDIIVRDINNIEGKYELLINATPVGMYPKIDEIAISGEILKNVDIVYDLIYNPAVTKLMKEGMARGCRVFNGENMLMWQAIKAQKIWLQG